MELIDRIKPYKWFRISFTAANSSSNGYITLNEVKFWDNYAMTGSSFLLGATATSNGDYQTYTPNLAIDGNDNTYWESSSAALLEGGMAKNPRRIIFELATPKKLLAFSILSKDNASGERPHAFLIEVSENGTDWFNYFRATKWSSTSDTVTIPKTQVLDTFVSGFVKTTAGTMPENIWIYRFENPFNTGLDVMSGNPAGPSLYFAAPIRDESTGEWLFFVERGYTYLVVYYTNASGYRPMCDGPMTPQALNQ